jgi:hypothetical protein
MSASLGEVFLTEADVGALLCDSGFGGLEA